MSALDVHSLPLGPLETNCFILAPVDAGGECWLVDVGMWSKPLVAFLRERALTPTRILLTHGHGDHIGGVEYVRKHYPAATIVCPRDDAEMLDNPELNLSATFLMGVQCPPADRLVRPGDVLEMGPLHWRVLDTSGHTPGGVSYFSPEANIVLTGDALFAGSIGRTDIPGGDTDRLLENIRENLLSLPDSTRVLPGHGAETTIAREKAGNPFLQPTA
jgi:glyoxylase-like metal-dependent hydrolase (beta-lactamase superfamily II)